MGDWRGYSVSIDCGPSKVYQGQIVDVTKSTFTICKGFLNGIPCLTSEVTINVDDILDLTVIDAQPQSSSCTPGKSTVTIAKPIAKPIAHRVGRSISECSNQQSSQTSAAKNRIVVDVTPTVQNFLQTTTYTNKNGKKRLNPKDEECFGSSVDVTQMQEFDFEKNLALFNKLNFSSKPDVVKRTDQSKKRIQRFRHDENVIATIPAMYRQITVAIPGTREYVTDDGLVVPSITSDLRRLLLSEAERNGLIWERQMELLGRAATEMALQLLGGAHRLNPHNSHQWPTVVVLCGPHRQGATGVNCARQLASHGVNTVIYITTKDVDSVNVLKCELDLFKLTMNQICCDVSALPSSADLMITALNEDADNPISYPMVAEWVCQNRAPVLALDPPAIGTPGIITKFSIVPVLPLSYSPDNGKIYLCNLGMPFAVFEHVGIKYRSPFGSKFVIPLHLNETVYKMENDFYIASLHMTADSFVSWFQPME